MRLLLVAGLLALCLLPAATAQMPPAIVEVVTDGVPQDPIAVGDTVTITGTIIVEASMPGDYRKLPELSIQSVAGHPSLFVETMDPEVPDARLMDQDQFEIPFEVNVTVAPGAPAHEELDIGLEFHVYGDGIERANGHDLFTTYTVTAALEPGVVEVGVPAEPVVGGDSITFDIAYRNTYNTPVELVPVGFDGSFPVGSERPSIMLEPSTDNLTHVEYTLPARGVGWHDGTLRITWAVLDGHPAVADDPPVLADDIVREITVVNEIPSDDLAVPGPGIVAVIGAILAARRR